MDKQIINNIMNFMMSANLTGQQVPAFTVAMNALQAELNKPEATTSEVKDGASE